MINKIDKDTIEVWELKEIVKKPDLEEKLSELESKLEEPEPTDKELIEFGKNAHPYYLSRIDLEKDIQILKDRLKVWQ